MKKLIFFLIIPCFSFTQDSFLSRLLNSDNTTEKKKPNIISLYNHLEMPETFEEFLNLYLKIGSYENTAHEYTIRATKPKDDGTYALCIDGHKYGNNNEGDCGLLMMSKKVNSFIKAWEDAKSKYIEWKEVAKTNNVKDFKKVMDIKIPKVYAYWYYPMSYTTDEFEPFFEFKVYDGKYFYLTLIIEEDFLDEKFGIINKKRFHIYFSSLSQINNFINSIRPEKVTSHYNKKKTIENLFKN